MKNLLKLNGAQKLSKNELTEILGSGPASDLCSLPCKYVGQECRVNGNCNSPGVCANQLGQLTCIPF